MRNLRMSPKGSDQTSNDHIEAVEVGMSELKPQEHASTDTDAQGSLRLDQQNDHPTSELVDGHAQVDIPELGSQATEQQRPRNNNCQTHMIQAVESTDVDFVQKHGEQEQVISKQEDHAFLCKQAEHVASAVPLFKAGNNDDHTVHQALASSAVHTPHCDKVVGDTPNESHGNVSQFHEHEPPEVPESVRSNPYALAVPGAADSPQASRSDMIMGEPRPIANQHQESATMAEDLDMHQISEPQHVSSGPECGIETTFGNPQVVDQQSGYGEEDEEKQDAEEEEEMQCTQNDSSDGPESEFEDDGEDNDGHLARIQAQLQAGVAKVRSVYQDQHQPLTRNDMNFLNLDHGKNIERYPGISGDGRGSRFKEDGALPRTQPFPMEEHHPNARGMSYMSTSQPQFDAPREVRQQLPNHHYSMGDCREAPGVVSRVRTFSPFDVLAQGVYQGATQTYQQHVSLDQHTIDYPNIGYSLQSYGQQAPVSAFSPYPMSTYDMHAQQFTPAPSSGYSLHNQAGPTRSSILQPRAREIEVIGKDDGTDDDEPLATRVPRHPSLLSDDSVKGKSLQQGAGTGYDEHDCGGVDDDVQFLASLSKQKPKQAPKFSTKVQETTSNPRVPLQPRESSPAQSPSESSAAASIDWKLPTFNVKFEPGKTKHDISIAKISIPGLIREEVLLSTDHAEQEADLFVNCFIPAQQSLATPDTHPAHATLNFHTIAVMVIEAYVQYEIGDEFGTGRGHWHTDHDEGDAEYQRLRDAKNADPDEIFFAVIDRWRAGMASGKEGATLIRGVQEFCETALDCVHYIKEHGLLKQRSRAVRSDKGLRRGAKKVDEDEDEGRSAGKGKTGVKKVGGEGKVATGSKGIKRGGETQVNTMVAKKKAKTTPAKSAPTKSRSKKKNDLGIMVVKAPTRKK